MINKEIKRRTAQKNTQFEKEDDMTDQMSADKPWYKRMWFIALAVIIVLAALGRGNKDVSSSGSTSAESNAGSVVATVGEKVAAGYFEVTVNSVLKQSCVGSDEFTRTCAGEGNQFLVLDVSLKNIDNEGRLFLEGSIFVNLNGKELEFDNTETIMEEGYLVLDTLNPLTSIRGKIVYKVPGAVSSAFYWNPGRSDVRILVAEGS